MKISYDRVVSLNRIAWRCSILFFAAILALVVNALYDFDFSNDGYILGDWLINFQDGGFKRRGLSGSFFFLLQDLTGLRLQLLVFSAQCLAYLALFFCLFLLFRDRALGLAFLVFIWSPLNLMVYFIDPNYAGRKEVLLFILFSLYALLIVRGGLAGWIRFLFMFSLAVATLFHEIPFFYIPYFLFLNFLHQRDFRLLSSLNVGLVLSVALPVLSIALFGGEIDNGQSLEILKNRGVEFDTSGGKPGVIWSVIPTVYIEPRKIALCLVVYLYVLFLLRMALPIQHRRMFIRLFLGCTLYSIPLFIAAFDWGRWLHIHFMMAMIAAVSLLPKKGQPIPVDEDAWTVRRLLTCAAFMVFNMAIMVDHTKGPQLNRNLSLANVKEAVGRRLKQ